MPWRAPFAVLAVVTVFAATASAKDIAHIIRPGDTPAALAKHYHVPVAALLARNTGIDPCRLKVGDTLVVPSPASPPSAVTAPPPDVRSVLPDEEASGPSYVVAPGDCPVAIAVRFGVPLEALLRANPGIDPEHLAVGRVLAIPATAPAAPPPVPVTRSGKPGQAAPLVMDFR